MVKKAKAQGKLLAVHGQGSYWQRVGKSDEVSECAAIEMRRMKKGFTHYSKKVTKNVEVL